MSAAHFVQQRIKFPYNERSQTLSIRRNQFNILIEVQQRRAGYYAQMCGYACSDVTGFVRCLMCAILQTSTTPTREIMLSSITQLHSVEGQDVKYMINLMQDACSLGKIYRDSEMVTSRKSRKYKLVVLSAMIFAVSRKSHSPATNLGSSASLCKKCYMKCSKTNVRIFAAISFFFKRVSLFFRPQRLTGTPAT